MPMMKILILPFLFWFRIPMDFIVSARVREEAVS